MRAMMITIAAATVLWLASPAFGSVIAKGSLSAHNTAQAVTAGVR